MQTRMKLSVAGLAATCLLAVAVTNATAARLSVSNKNFRIAWAALNMTSTGIGGVNIPCPVTMEGSFHSATLRKVLAALVAHVSRATVAEGSCTGGRSRVNQGSLPWHVQYGGFTGTLPNITGVHISLVGAEFTAITEAATCTTHTTASRPAKGIANLSSGRLTGLQADETAEIPLEAEFACFFAGEGRFAGTGTGTVLGSTTAITIRLI
jgi:hypothetical protein